MYPIFILGLISGLIGFFGVFLIRTSKVDKIIEEETHEINKLAELTPSNVKETRLGILTQIKRIMKKQIIIIMRTSKRKFTYVNYIIIV